MSSGLERGDRDLAAELESPATGQIGIPVDAICTGCGRIHVKRSPLESIREASTDTEPTEFEVRDLTSFKHVCHRCQTATWWNPVAVLSGLLEHEEGE